MKNKNSLKDRLLLVYNFNSSGKLTKRIDCTLCENKVILKKIFKID